MNNLYRDRDIKPNFIRGNNKLIENNLFFSEKINKNFFDNKSFNPNQNNNIDYNNDIKSDNSFYLKPNEFINNELIYNNVHNEIRNEFIQEIDIIIDTIDRDLDYYPNIFDFKTIFNPTNTTPNPTISKSFDNVKYISIKKITLPDNYHIEKINLNILNLEEKYLNKLNIILDFINNNIEKLKNNDYSLFDEIIETNDVKIYIIFYINKNNKFYIDFFEDNYDIPNYDKVYNIEINNLNNFSTISSNDILFNLYTPLSDTQLENCRYLKLNIENLPEFNFYTKNNNNLFSILIPGKQDRKGYNDCSVCQSSKVFKFSNLISISNLKISIQDSIGDIIKTNQDILNKDNILNIYDSKNYENIININNKSSKIFKYSFRSARKYIRHPLCWRMQGLFIFTIGHVIIEINKKNYN